MPKIFFLLLGLASFIAGGGVLPSAFGADEVTDVVVISPGEDIQSIVDAHLPGTSYLLLTGVHRMQSVKPKDGDSFTGETGAVMSGAVRLGLFVPQKGYWLVGAPHASAAPTGKCEKDENGNPTDICTYLEDLFLDSEPLRRVGVLEDVEPGTWFFDYDKGFVIIADNPRDREVELSVMRSAFRGAAGNVIITGLVFVRFFVGSIKLLYNK